MFVTVDELKTHIYGELVDAITEGDDDILPKAILGAIEEVASYLSDFDVDAIFGVINNSNVDAINITDERHPLILLYTKDIAVWHFIALANPNIELALREKRYDAAIVWLRRVQKRELVPRGLPKLPTNPDTGNTPGQRIFMTSNPRRENHI